MNNILPFEVYFIGFITKIFQAKNIFSATQLSFQQFSLLLGMVGLDFWGGGAFKKSQHWISDMDNYASLKKIIASIPYVWQTHH